MNRQDEILLQLTQMLLKTLEELSRMKAVEPGEKSHMIAYTTNFIKDMIRKVIKLQKMGPAQLIINKLEDSAMANIDAFKSPLLEATPGRKRPPSLAGKRDGIKT